MNDEPASGNRWEPSSRSAPEPVDDRAPASPPPAPSRHRPVRRVLMAGAAAVLFVGGGAGGYALVHAAADGQVTPTGFSDGQRGFDDQRGFEDHDGSDGPPPGLPPGQRPPSGQDT